MKIFKWIACFFSCITMSISPLAQGVEAKRKNHQLAQTLLQEMGLSGPRKAKTMGEVWDRMKDKLPAETRKQLSILMNYYRYEKVPEISLEKVQGKNPTD